MASFMHKGLFSFQAFWALIVAIPLGTGTRSTTKNVSDLHQYNQNVNNLHIVLEMEGFQDTEWYKTQEPWLFMF